MLTTSHLDWLSITYEIGIVLHATIPQAFASVPFKRQGSGAHGYRDRYSSEIGVVAMSNGTAAQGTHVVISGTALENMRSAGVTDREVCRHVLERGGKVQRIDLALNLHGAQLTVDDLAFAFQESRLKTPARAGKHIKGINVSDNGLYIGGRQSERYLRAYDKKAEQKIVDGDAWLRLELECKKARARAVAAAVADHENTRTVINRAIGDYLSYPTNQELTTALADNDATIAHIPRKMTDTERWLLEVCAPALARYVSEHPSESMEQSFWTAYQVALETFAPGPHENE